VFNLGLSEVVILFIVFPVPLVVGLWIWAARRDKRRRTQAPTPPR
jgi:hypothetical protein